MQLNTAALLALFVNVAVWASLLLWATARVWPEMREDLGIALAVAYVALALLVVALPVLVREPRSLAGNATAEALARHRLHRPPQPGDDALLRRAGVDPERAPEPIP